MPKCDRNSFLFRPAWRCPPNLCSYLGHFVFHRRECNHSDISKLCQCVWWWFASLPLRFYGKQPGVYLMDYRLLLAERTVFPECHAYYRALEPDNQRACERHWPSRHDYKFPCTRTLQTTNDQSSKGRFIIHCAAHSIRLRPHLCLRWVYPQQEAQEDRPREYNGSTQGIWCWKIQVPKTWVNKKETWPNRIACTGAIVGRSISRRTRGPRQAQWA